MDKMGYDTLKAILDSSDVIKKYSTFGTNLPPKSSLLAIDSKAKVMISRCKEWMTNWETVQEAIAPEVDEIRYKLMEAKVATLNKKQLDFLLEAIETRKNSIQYIRGLGLS